MVIPRYPRPEWGIIAGNRGVKFLALPALGLTPLFAGPFHLAENRSLSRYFVPLRAYLRLKAEFLSGNLTHREPGERALPLFGVGMVAALTPRQARATLRRFFASV